MCYTVISFRWWATLRVLHIEAASRLRLLFPKGLTWPCKACKVVNVPIGVIILVQAPAQTAQRTSHGTYSLSCGNHPYLLHHSMLHSRSDVPEPQPAINSRQVVASITTTVTCVTFVTITHFGSQMTLVTPQKRFRLASMSALLRLGLRLGFSRHSSVVSSVLQQTAQQHAA
jgi:hypothetical protein